MGALANTIISMIDSPEKRAKAIREYVETLLALQQKISRETDDEKVDRLLNDLIDLVRGG